ncbi:MAG TPA: ATP-binding protein [Actinomycetota bacterium]|nr:ATP-binding protein [Actinomycetota bacterium]
MVRRFRSDRREPLETVEQSDLLEVESLLHAAGAINAATGLDESLRTVLRSASRVFEADEGSVMIYDHEGFLTIRASEGIPSDIAVSIRVAPGQGIAGHVARSAKSMLIPADAGDLNLHQSPAGERNIKSALSVPLRSVGRTIGVLNLNRTGDGPPFDRRDLKLAEIFGALAAAILEKTSILEEATQTGMELSQLVEASKGLIGGVEIEPLMDNIMNGAVKLAGARAGLACLFDRGAGRIKVAVYKGLDREAVREALGRRGFADLFARRETFNSVASEIPILEELAEEGEQAAMFPVLTDPSNNALVITFGPPVEERRLRLCETFASQAGLAIHNSELFDRVGTKETELQSIVYSIRSPILVVDLEGNLIEANPAAEELFGFSAEFVKGQTVIGLLHEPAVEDLLLGASEGVTEVTTGRPMPRLWKVRTSLISSGQGGRILIMDDVTSEREMERLKADFVAVIGHELRTPLTLIQGFVKTLIKRGDQLTDDQKQDSLSTIETQSGRLGRLIEDLLYLSRIERTRPTLELKEIDLVEVTRTLVQEFRGRQSAREITLRGPGELRMMLDETKIEQVLFHIIDNACKYSEPDAPVNIALSSQADEVNISVKDRGIGILSGDLPHLFERFHQIDQTSTRKAGGTGVGLYICKSLVEAHGGRIEVDSAWGKGSTFKIVIPREA